jgi:hypothetical protein|tara:strand:+ start:8655 stop:8933 length:279 start_codon:yes stop_codon:yes gene_type:complete
MAAIAIGDTTIHYKQEGGVAVAYVVTPATADSADTVDLTTILQGRTISDIAAWDTTSEDSVTATVSSDVVTLDAAGGTTNHVYVIKAALIQI